MSRWWHYAVEAVALAFFAVTAAAAAPVVVASEAGFFLAGVGMTAAEANAVLTTSLAGAALAGSAIVAEVVSDTVGKTNKSDPFGSPIKSRPMDDSANVNNVGDDMDEDEDVDEVISPQVVTGVSQTSTETISHTETETKRIPLVGPFGDYAGIQKTMYNPVTGSVIGMKMHARGRRGIFGGNFHSVKKIVATSRSQPVKVTHHSPVSVLNFSSP